MSAANDAPGASLEISGELYRKLLRAKVYAPSPDSEPIPEEQKTVKLTPEQRVQFENGLALGSYLRVLKSAMVGSSPSFFLRII
jgi:hypothetical protein